MTTGRPDYSAFVDAAQRDAWSVGQTGAWTVTSNQGGAWSVAQSGNWDVQSIQSGAWVIGQSGNWNVGQTGTWEMFTKEYKGKPGIKRFAEYVSVAKDTAEGAPQTSYITLVAGTIEGLGVIIPRGHAGLTGIRLAQESTLLVPTEASQWLEGDDDKFYNDVRHDIVEEAGPLYRLTVTAFNEDDTYAHTFLVLVWVEAT